MVQPDDFILEHLLNTQNLLAPYNKPHRRELYRWLSSKLKAYLENETPDTVLLLGIRGVGKTTLLAQLYFEAIKRTSPNNILYLSLDRLKALGLELLEVIDAYRRLVRPKNAVLLLDEVQYERDWDLKLKLLHDERRFLIIATGSSAIKLRESPDLARRALHRELFPMTFREYHLLKTGRELPELMERILWGQEVSMPPITEDVELYVRAGSMPLILEMEEWEVYERLTAMLDRVIYRDLRDVHEFDAETLDKTLDLLHLLATPKGERFSYERLSKTLGLAKGTVMKLIDALEKAGLVQRIPPCGSLSKAKRKSPKIKFIAVPIKSALLFGSGFSLGKKEVFASLLEDVVAFYLFLLAKSRNGKLCYEPGKGGADFVLEVGGEKVVVEVGLGKVRKDQVERSMERLGAKKGIVLGSKYEVGDRIAFYPWQMFVAGF
ncbi:ATP-binding protein [Thermococcus nautili]|uniref:Putative ATPase (AAA+ superfamily) n=1 Tax=Thermococcus nautili TaxID=195522 RepID=W8P5H9_9EURY|nr:ATP-binding protein [Thermococcus nautili]AHL22705.1 putative ATPase (AAA+ superfamily) [Thermococcus nautili]